MHETTPRCFANHMGLYLCEPNWLTQAVALVRAGAYPLIDARPPTPRERLYHVGTDGVAVIPMSGPLFKGGSKFSSASTVDVRRAVRQARDDPEVRGILLHIDSPGGHVAGIQELADEVRATDKVKPVHAHLDDLGASAAYWVASQARHVTANATAQVGSIGVVAIVEDSSGAAELQGVKVHVVATGERKGDFVPGAPGQGLDPHVDHVARLERVGQPEGHLRGRSYHVGHATGPVSHGCTLRGGGTGSRALACVERPVRRGNPWSVRLCSRIAPA